MSAEATGWCWRYSPFKGSHAKFLLHLAVADIVNDAHDNEFWISQGALARKAGTSRKAVNEFLAEAIEIGLLVLVEDNSSVGRPNRYRMLMPETLRDASEAPVVSPEATEGAISGGRGVSPQVTGGVTSGDRGCHLRLQGVLPEVTGGVTSGDTIKLKRTKEELKEELKEEKRRLPQAEADSLPVLALSASSPTRETFGADATERDGTDGGRGERGAQLVAIAGGEPAGRPAKGERQAEIVRRVFDAWIEATGTNPKTARLNAKRRAKIVARLNEGYSEQDLIDAVRGVMLSPFHTGDNETGTRYVDIVTSLRDGGQVEKFRDLYRRGGRPEGRRMSNTDRVRQRLGLV